MTKEEQKALIRRWQDQKCHRSRERLMREMEGYVHYWVARYNKFSPNKHDWGDDLFQAGCIGAMRAIDKFDTERPGAKMSTYAAFWIKAYMLREMNTYHAGMKYPHKAAVRELLPSYGKIYSWARNRFPSASREEIREIIAKETGNSVETVQYVEEVRTPLKSLNDHVGEDGTAELGDFVPSRDPSPEELALAKVDNEITNEHLVSAMGLLNDKQRYVITKRYLEADQTLQQIGEVLEVSRQRVEQIEKAALKKLKSILIMRREDEIYKRAS